jgi:zinc and cadmium transporter
MTVLAWIVASGLAMAAVALVGAVALLLPRRWLDELMLPLVAMAAGSLLGGALFHMIPGALRAFDDSLSLLAWVAAGFSAFLLLEQYLHWHHCHRASAGCREPMSVLILLGDGLHNFLGGLTVAGAFLVDVRLGVTTWLAAGAHEVPQELGDFAVLVHAGWSRGRALVLNFLSALTFLVGGVVAYAASFETDVSFLVPFAAGNFLYIAASDLVPEVNRHHDPFRNALHFACFLGGLLLLWALASAPS